MRLEPHGGRKGISRSFVWGPVAVLTLAGLGMLLRDDYDRKWSRLPADLNCPEILTVKKRSKAIWGTAILMKASGNWQAIGLDARVVADSGLRVVALVGERKAPQALPFAITNLNRLRPIGEMPLILILDGYELHEVAVASETTGFSAFIVVGEWRKPALELKGTELPTIVLTGTSGELADPADRIRVETRDRPNVVSVTVAGVGAELGSMRASTLRAACEALRTRFTARAVSE